MEAISTKNLCKKYGEKTVVKNLNLSIPEKAIYGFIGRNGAGKTTTQKMVSGLANATSGEISIFGKNITDTSVRANIGTLIEQPAFYPSLSVHKNMVLQSYNIGLSQPKEKIDKILKDVGLFNAANKKAKHLSLGMKQRLGLAMAMLGNPKLLILDEPINGLDPEGIVEFRNILEKLNKEQGTTIFISSHILGELSKIATHYGIIKDGELIQQVSAETMQKQLQTYLVVKVKDANRAKQILEEQLHLENIEMISNTELHIKNYSDTKQVNKILYSNDFDVLEIFVHQQDLEEYFLNLMGGN